MVEELFAREKRAGNVLFFQQDGASAHVCERAVQALEDLKIPTIYWPPKSPDLSPIETVWKIMKDWISKNYPDYVSAGSQNKRIVQEAWDAVGSNELRKLARTMPQRLRDIIAVQGGHTHW